MSREVSVHLLPEHFEPAALRGSVAVVIDVLRASTTIVHAIQAGAACVIPFGEVHEALEFAAGEAQGSVVLGGERGGARIDCFDLDNSPLSYTPETVRGKIVAFTTTNGTRALLHSRLADRILIGAFVNFSAIINALTDEKRPVHFVCAGTDGQTTAEDTLCAEALAEHFHQRLEWNAWFSSERPGPRTAEDRRRLREPMKQRQRLWSRILPTLRESSGGQNLLALGYDADIRQAAKLDLFHIVPEYQTLTGRIVDSASIW
jgi:2-phosphosulfolactate phosphatase